jgi:hypothetical protein
LLIYSFEFSHLGSAIFKDKDHKEKKNKLDGEHKILVVFCCFVYFWQINFGHNLSLIDRSLGGKVFVLLSWCKGDPQTIQAKKDLIFTEGWQNKVGDRTKKIGNLTCLKNIHNLTDFPIKIRNLKGGRRLLRGISRNIWIQKSLQ